jgi:hypothetical protein
MIELLMTDKFKAYRRGSSGFIDATSAIIV